MARARAAGGSTGRKKRATKASARTKKPAARTKKTAARTKKVSAGTKKAAARTKKVSARTKKASGRTKKAPARGKKKRRSTRGRWAPPRAPRPKSVALGDAVALNGGEFERLGLPGAGRGRTGDQRPEAGGETIEGVVCAIRDISTGKLVGKTRGALEQYVLELLQDRTFSRQFSSNRNVGGPRGPEDLASNPAWAKVRETLREMAREKRFMSQSSGELSREVFDALLDGWRVLKVRARPEE